MNKKYDSKWIVGVISTAIMAMTFAVNDDNRYQKLQRKSLNDACCGQNRCFFRILLYALDLVNCLVYKRILTSS